jgi:hypothetical protein
MGLVKLNLVKGDTLPALVFTVSRGGVVLNLTGATVKFKFKPAAGGAQVNPAADTCTLTDPTNGVATYSWGANDLATAGEYIGELEITFAGGTIQTGFDQYLMIVRDAQ